MNDFNRHYKNNLGKTVTLSPSTFVKNQYGKLGAEGSFTTVFDTAEEASDSQLTIYNIATWMGGYTLPLGQSGRYLAFLGKLIWGIGGASFEADFDWKVGTQLSVCASFVRVSAAYSQIGPSQTAPEVAIGAMVSSGSRAARAQVTRTYPRITLDNSAPKLFPIPPFAHALNLFSAQSTFYGAGAVTVRYVGGVVNNNQFSAASTDLVSWVSDGAVFLPALANEDGVRFPEAARFVELSTASGSFDVTPCFTLSL